MRVKILRRLLFFIFVLIFIILTIIIEHFDMDKVFYIYLCVNAVGYSILGYWVYWFIRSEERTAIFKMFGWLVFATIIPITFYVYSRFIYLHYKQEFLELLNSRLWAYRMVPVYLVLSWLLAWIMARIHGKGDHDV
jgi:hypothetical protein